MLEINTMSDMSSLTQAKGFWSGNDIYFNTDSNRIVIIDPELTTKDIPAIVDTFLRENLVNYTQNWLTKIHTKSQLPLIEWIQRGKLKHYFKTRELPEQATWKERAEWLRTVSSSELGQRNAFAKFLSAELRKNPEIIFESKPQANIFRLCMPLITQTMDNWKQSSAPISDTVDLLALMAFHDSLTLKKRERKNPALFFERASDAIHFLREQGVTIPQTTKHADLFRVHNLSAAARLILGLLRLRKRILLPATVEASFYQQLTTYGDQAEVSRVTRQACQKGFLLRLLISSTIDSLADIPEDIAALSSHVPDSQLLNSTLSRSLSDYATENSLPAFPLGSLHRTKARRGSKAAAYSVDWLKAQSVPD